MQFSGCSYMIVSQGTEQQVYQFLKCQQIMGGFTITFLQLEQNNVAQILESAFWTPKWSEKRTDKHPRWNKTGRK